MVFCKKIKLLTILLFPIVILIISFFGVTSVAAKETIKIKNENYSAKYLSQSILDPITIEVGKTKNITIKFKNTGKETWNAKGGNYVAAFAVEPKERASVFKTTNWIAEDQPAKIFQTTKPGETGEITFQLKAPKKTGDYTEYFHLASYNNTWIKGGNFYLKIKVVDNSKSSEQQNEVIKTEDKDAKVVDRSYETKRYLLSKKQFTAAGGEELKLIVGYRNTGTSTWQNYSLIADEKIDPVTYLPINFADSSWKAKKIILSQQKNVAPGQNIKETFVFRAPIKKGTYQTAFYLQADNKKMIESKIEIKIEVIEDAIYGYQEPVFETNEIFVPKLSEEPTLRVGIQKLEEPTQKELNFASGEDDYYIFNGEENVGILPRSMTASLKLIGAEYFYKDGNLEFSTNKYLRLTPVNNKHAVFELTKFKRTIEWHKNKNFNQYRGGFEFRLTEDGKDLYAINDVLMEDYVAGIAETTNNDPMEYTKALLTAARTYAYYIKENTGKHDKRNFDVVAHTGDQLYLGYISEKQMPRVKEATLATFGQMITYEDNVVVTPYFGNSDGRTRSWKEVWGGKEKPWLVSVVTSYDERDNKKMYGHGVGMSARDAMIRAHEENLEWQDLIKYYYKGVEVQRFY